MLSRVQVVVPDSIDDPARPSGGNVYDRRLCRALTAQGWSVHEHPMAGGWPHPGPEEQSRVAGLLAGLPDHEVVLLDGLIASASAAAIRPQADRLRLVVLVHQLLVDALPAAGPTVREQEAVVLRSAHAVVLTSGWSRDRALHCHRLDPDRLHVAEPGTDRSVLARGSATGTRLLCVGVVAPHKGQDVLLAALEQVASTAWDCTCVGSLERDRPFVTSLEHTVRAAGLGPRMRFTGALSGPALGEHYSRSDLLVVPSRTESYGMVATEALARGIPVLASHVGGLPAAIGCGSDTGPAGLLVPAGEAGALAAALQRWLQDTALRAQLRDRARQRREVLPGWSATAQQVATAIASTR